jgi:XdhC and CoxI family.
MGACDISSDGRFYLSQKPGARLLVDSDGDTLGIISGSCLEEEIGRRGQIVIENGSPLLLSFDTKRLYGCDGQLKIPVGPANPRVSEMLLPRITDRPEARAYNRGVMTARKEAKNCGCVGPDLPADESPSDSVSRFHTARSMRVPRSVRVS